MNNYPDCDREIAENTVENNAVDYSDVALIQQKNSVLNAVREWAKSKLFLVTTIALMLTVVLSVVSSVTTAGGILTYDDMTANASKHVGTIIVGDVIIMIPCILMAVGMWMTYSSASRENEKMSTKGFGIIRVSLIIASVITVLLIVTMICMLPAIYAMRDTLEPLLSHKFGEYPAVDGWAFLFVFIGAAMALVVVVIIVTIIFLIVLSVLAFVSLMRALRSVKVIKSTVGTGVVTGKISAFAAVMSIIFGSFCAFLSLNMLGGEIMTGISSLVSAVTLVLLGVVLFNYRSKINKVLKEQAIK